MSGYFYYFYFSGKIFRPFFKRLFHELGLTQISRFLLVFVLMASITYGFFFVLFAYKKNKL